MFPPVLIANSARASPRRLARCPLSSLHYQKSHAVISPLGCSQQQRHAYTTQIQSQDIPKNETSRYLDRLKDDEIAFQSVPEYVHGDFWKTEPGTGRQYRHVDNNRADEKIITK